MKQKRIRIITIFIFICCLGVLSSCANNNAKKTSYLVENASSGCSKNTNSKSKYDWLITQIEKDVDVSYSLEEKLYGKDVENEETGEITKTANYIDNLKYLISSYANYSEIAGSTNEKKIEENFHVQLIKNDNVRFLTYIDNINSADSSTIDDLKVSLNGTAGCLDTKSEKISNEALSKVEEVNDVYRLAALYLIQVDLRISELEPIVFKARTVGEFFANFWNNIFIFPLAWLIYFLSKIFGGYYIIGLIIATILVRTLGWPIYAKTNDMSLKMGLMQPEQQAIQEKYAGKNDPDSKRMMQMEQAQLFKKYKVGFGGCLAPLLQFPIFMAIFRAISRIPYTKAIENSSIYTLNWSEEMKPSFLGVNLFEGRNGGGINQLIGILILIVLVVGTQVLSQIISQKRQKSAQQKSQENIPAYRRQAYNQTQNSTQNTMKFMLWFMIIMMGAFVWSSKAGLGIYWLIGNLYSMLQMVINNATSEKKMEKLKQKHSNIIDYKNK